MDHRCGILGGRGDGDGEAFVLDGMETLSYDCDVQQLEGAVGKRRCCRSIEEHAKDSLRESDSL